ncbi:MAG: regulatory protein RecX [Candidatus Zixiibacteriota bacterium]
MHESTITALSTHPARPGRVRVYIDGMYAFELSRKVILAQDVTEGEVLSAERRRELEMIAIREAAIALLARRERSRAELAAGLRRKRFSPALIDAVLGKIEADGLQSDARFADAWVGTRRRLSPRGRLALVYELKQRGIGESEIGRAIGQYTPTDEREALRELIAARLPRLTASGGNKEKVKHRLLSFLARRGFAYDDVRAVLAAHFPEWL